MKRKNTIDEIGVFNILLIGRSSSAISVADNIHAKFKNDAMHPCCFNIISDIDGDEKIPSIGEWFNKFIFEMSTTATKFNNIVVSGRFKDWMCGSAPIAQRIYMKKLLQAMNVVIVDVSLDDDDSVFDYDIPQCKFNVEKDFGVDLFKWIDEQLEKISRKMPIIRLVRSLSGKNIPYLGDVFGCLSGKQYKNIIRADKMRFDVPILFDEFCYLTAGYDQEWLDDAIITRSNSALASFFK